MNTGVESEFVDFISWLSGSIIKKLDKHFPDLEQVTCRQDLFAGMDRMITNAVSDWTVHMMDAAPADCYEDLTVILYIHLFGHLNKSEILDSVYRPKFIFMYLNLLDRIMHNEMVSNRLIYFAEKLMLNRAA